MVYNMDHDQYLEYLSKKNDCWEALKNKMIKKSKIFRLITYTPKRILEMMEEIEEE